MSTAQTPRFVAQLSNARRVAAGLALVLTLGALAALSQLADHQYDSALMAQAGDPDSATQVVVITGKRTRHA